MNEWIYRINVIIPDALKTIVAALWTIIAPEGNSEALSFDVPLSPTGGGAPSHWGMSTAATEDMRTLIEQVFTDDLSTCYISIQDAALNDWDAHLAAHGLKTIQTEVI